MIERLRFDESPERLPPHNIEAEEAVLGSVLLDRAAIDRVAGILLPRDFYRERNGTIFQAMTDLADRQEPVDFLTLHDHLERAGLTDQVGGAPYIAGLIGAVPSPIHAEHYAKAVADAAVMRRLISAGGKIAALGFEGRFDPSTALEKAEQLLLDVASRRAVTGQRLAADVLREYLDRVAAYDEHAASTAVPTGYADLDRLLCGGLQRSDLAILAARPSMGKTSLAMGVVSAAALTYKAGVAVFSLEMSSGQLMERLLAAQTGITTERLRTGQINDMESHKLGNVIAPIAEAALIIDDTSGLSVGEVRARVRRMQAETPLDLVVIDHIQLLTAGEAFRGKGLREEMTEISRQLKALARDHNVAVLALSQLSRAVDQRSPKIPILSDLRESGSIEQDADVVVFIYRDDYYNRDSERPGIADLHVAKHRNGPTGQVSLLWNQRTTRFLDLEYGQ